MGPKWRRATSSTPLFQSAGARDDLPEVWTTRPTEASRQDPFVSALRPSPDLPTQRPDAVLMSGPAILAIAVGLLALFSIPLRRKP